MCRRNRLRGPTHCRLFFAGTTKAEGDKKRRDAAMQALMGPMAQDIRPIMITTGNDPLPTTSRGIRPVPYSTLTPPTTTLLTAIMCAVVLLTFLYII